jgi:glutamyl-tRNA synthetase
MTARVRFAPSPTGNIHIGNARTALVNWLYARQQRGEFVLRFDDTDRERSRQEYADNIAEDLHWLGIKPHRVEYQARRAQAHEAATNALKQRGLLYACYETPDELDRKRKRQQARGLPPVYDRSGLRLMEEERKELEAEGRKPHWRFLLPNHDGDPFETRRTEVHWDDLIRGPQTVDLASMSDPVLVREDGTWLYTLPSVVDDIEFGITHIIRGDDHVTNTGVQIALFEALGAAAPGFGHHNLLTTASGEGLSKRLGSLSIRSLREEGYEPMAVTCLATLIGAAGSVEALPDMQALQERFDISAIGKSAAKFDVSELDALNRKLVHEMEWPQVSNRFDEGALGPDPQAFWNVVRENIDKVGEASDWWQRIETAEPVIGDEDREYLAMAREALPAGEFDQSTWGAWTAALK